MALCLNRLVAALYRKYRPQSFEEVVGQEAVVRTLSNAIATEAVRQAYLFAGPRGTGKTSMARILAKCLNCVQGPTITPDGTCHACRAIAAGTSLDVIEMDAASQRGIDDIREIRDRVVLQPVEGAYKIYILDEAHQLTDAAWNALLKLIEEPPPHLVFVFCTTDLSKVLPTVRSRCQTFVFQRPGLQDLVKVLRQIADAEGIDAPDQALALVARSGRGAYRDAVSTLDQLASATGNQVTVPAVLELLGTVEEEALFRLCDLVIDRDTAGALTYVEELSERGHDLGRLVLDLIEHLRQLMLAQHLGDVPEAAATSEEARERLQAQANQLGEATVLRLVDLLAVAVDDMRQGGDPRLPLELALVKVTRPASDLSRESIAFRLERLEHGQVQSGPVSVSVTEAGPERPVAEPEPEPEPVPVPVGAPPALELSQLQEAWTRTVLPAVEERGGIPTASLLREAHPADLSGDTLTLEFPPTAQFHLDLVRDPKNAGLLSDALYDVTGRRLELVFELGEAREAPAADEEPAGEEQILELLKETFDARERES
ncbi:MAG: DNA polymerase III subunit gamma/tau [Actinobacteria bacterium]|nr:MAG: DNA polymerase III subunit gamma/tau [Actinomycetota bacterium]